jgi:hypothetical protein
VFWDESGASLLPVTRRTWAPRGRTPVICHHFNWKRASMTAGLCCGSRGGGAQLAFHHQVGAYDTDTLIGALEGLRRFLGGQKVTLLWDGLPAHRSHAMRAWLRRQRSWLVVEPLPAYAPELNPVEPLWSTSKGWSWPTWPARASTTSLRRPSVASSGLEAPTSWPTRSCATAACPYGEPSMMSPEGANLFLAVAPTRAYERLRGRLPRPSMHSGRGCVGLTLLLAS